MESLQLLLRALWLYSGHCASSLVLIVFSLSTDECRNQKGYVDPKEWHVDFLGIDFLERA